MKTKEYHVRYLWSNFTMSQNVFPVKKGRVLPLFRSLQGNSVDWLMKGGHVHDYDQSECTITNNCHSNLLKMIHHGIFAASQMFKMGAKNAHISPRNKTLEIFWKLS